MSASSLSANSLALQRQYAISAALLRRLLPAASFVILLGAIIFMNRRAGSYLGLTLLLNLAVPMVLATMSQMMVMAVNDNDFSVGPFVSFVACVCAVWLANAPLFAVGVLLAAIAAYAVLGALIRRGDCRRSP